jgi:hypothetical protein
MYAEHRDLRLAIGDAPLCPFTFDPHGMAYEGRYMVAVGPEECASPETCTSTTRGGHSRAYYVGDEFEETRRVFDRLERALLIGIPSEA